VTRVISRSFKNGHTNPEVEEVDVDREMLFILAPVIWGLFCLGWGLLLESLRPGSGEKEEGIPLVGGTKE